MTEKIKYIGDSGLIWQPDVRVSSFASGLLLVQRSCIARKNTRARPPAVGERLELEGEKTGAIDQVYIFPNPQLVQNDPAFFRWEVSGYGRWTNSKQVSKQSVLTPSGNYVVERYTLSFVVPENSSVNPFSYFPTEPPTIFTRSGFQFQAPAAAWQLQDFTQTNYGRVTEISLTFGVSNFE